MLQEEIPHQVGKDKVGRFPVIPVKRGQAPGMTVSVTGNDIFPCCITIQQKEI